METENGINFGAVNNKPKHSMKTRQILAEEESEWTTKMVWKSGNSYFVAVQNGGYNGSHQPRDQVNGDWGFYHEGPTKISQDEALALCAAMGVEEVNI